MNAPQKNTIATSIDAISPEQHAAAKNAGQAWARKDKAELEILDNFARSLGDKCTKLQYDTMAADFKQGWLLENPNKTTAAMDKAWSRFKGMLEDMFEIEILKPSSTDPASIKRAEERAAKKAVLDQQFAQVSADQVAQKIEQTYAALAKNPTSSALKKEVKDLEKVYKDKTADQAKARMETLKVLRSQVREAANKCTEEDTLQAALDILAGNADFDYNA